MKQRVAVALATVWLASIVGASVPSGETTAFSTPRPPGPSPDQYTPLLRNPWYYPQDDYRQDWMNDEPSRIKVTNNRKSSGQDKPAITDSDWSGLLESPPNEFFNRGGIRAEMNSATPYDFQSKDTKTQSQLDKEAIRLSSMKVAFDELSDSTSQEDWISHEPEEEDQEDEMQQDQFVADEDTFEDQGPGSVEVYQLDLNKDGSILIPKPLMKNYLRNKSKIPKKVGAVDSASSKAKDPEESKQHGQRTVSTSKHNSDQLTPPSAYFTDRIFGAGGVPELQVGCEGVEGSQRQKRSDSKEPVNGGPAKIDGTLARSTPLFIDPEYDSEEYLDVAGGTDELFKILKKGALSTASPLPIRNRGDMDPRVKTPADIEADKIQKQDKLPVRGDLGPSEGTGINKTQENDSNRDQSQVKSSRKLLSLEENVEENVRTKRESEWAFRKWENRGHHGVRRGRSGRRPRHHGNRDDYERSEHEERRSSNAMDKTRNVEYEKLSYDAMRKRLDDYERKNTPITRPHNAKDNQWEIQPRNNIPPQNQRLPTVPVHFNARIDQGAGDWGRIEEQRRPETAYTSRSYQRQQELLEREKARQATATKWNNRTYRRRSREEIEKLNAMPVSARIFINPQRSGKAGIGFPGLNPSSAGRPVPNFLAPTTTSPPVKGPSPCDWAIVTCCTKQKRVEACLKTMGCNANSDRNVCSQRSVEAALAEISKTFDNDDDE